MKDAFHIAGQDWHSPEIASATEVLYSMFGEKLHGGPACGIPELVILDDLPFIFYVKDVAGRFVVGNRKALEMLGVERVDQVYGKTAADFFDEKSMKVFERLDAELLEGHAPFLEVELEKPHAGDSEHWVMLVHSPLRDKDGAITGIIALGRDITKRKRAEFLRKGHAALLEQIARGYPLLNIIEDLVHLVEAQLTDIRASILFYDEETGCLRNGAAPALPAEYTALIDGIKAGQNVGSCGTAAWFRTPVTVSDTYTDPRWANYVGIAKHFGLRSCWSTPIIDGSGTLFGTFALYSGTVREPSELEMEITAMATDLAAIAIARARTEEQVRHLANHDALTGLPNRRYFLESFAEAIEQADAQGRHLVISYFDLDGFKQINDTLGHGVGDRVLREVATRLKQSVRASDLAVRLGGDEFAVVMACAPDEETQLVARLRELSEDLARPMRHGDRTIVCGGSMGIAVFPRDGRTPDALLARADAGMYTAKNARRQRGRIDVIRSI